MVVVSRTTSGGGGTKHPPKTGGRASSPSRTRSEAQLIPESPGCGRAPGHHLRESNSRCAVHHAMRDRPTSGMERRRSSPAIVVDVDDWNAGTPDALDCRLARGGVHIDETGVSLLNHAVVDTGILRGETDRLRSHEISTLSLSGFGEGDHSDAGDACLAHRSAPDAPMKNSWIWTATRRIMLSQHSCPRHLRTVHGFGYSPSALFRSRSSEAGRRN